MAADDFKGAALIAVDWGTSRLRARLLAGDGATLAEAKSEEGIGQNDGNHEAIFERLAGAWPAVPAIMAGMVGSRQGWREVAYVPCPATPDQIARAVLRFTTANGRPVAIVPGVRLAAPERDGDVMRGEETKVIGIIEREPDFDGVCIMPGTHPKWARIDKGAIVSFQTFISGELFELMSRKSFLRHSVADGAADLAAEADFALGVERTARRGLPFVAALFSVRARQLLGAADKASNLAYLSGLIVGGEMAAAEAMSLLLRGAPLCIAGAPGLARVYQTALSILGHEASVLDGDALVFAGLTHMARAIGFLKARAMA